MFVQVIKRREGGVAIVLILSPFHFAFLFYSRFRGVLFRLRKVSRNSLVGRFVLECLPIRTAFVSARERTRVCGALRGL